MAKLQKKKKCNQCLKQTSGYSLKISDSNIQKQPPKFCKKGVLKNFAKFTEKQLCQSLFFNKVASCFPVNFAKFLRTFFA